jgi:DNA invertase Pin-like site-specific DNA recombinase
VAKRPGFKAMLDRIAGNGVRVILVESPDRFARDLSVQITGHDYLRSLGVELVPTSAPDFFTTDTPTAVLVRQVLGAVSQFEKANLVAKLRAARERKMAAGGRGSGASPMLRRCRRWSRWCASCMGSASRCGRYRRRSPRKVMSPAAAGPTPRLRCRRCCEADRGRA